MSVVFVIGPSCGGKSTYIQQNYSNRRKIDLYDFEKSIADRNGGRLSIDDVTLAYEECKNALVEAIKNNEEVVLEHTMLRAERRKKYIDAIRQISDIPIEVVVIYPSNKEILNYAKQRNINISRAGLRAISDIYEEPTYGEGFSKITILS